ncbi:hypothetical protein U6G28_00105 [Actinomycetaceae bacterium MB13-C1-2]|nr:hypothetical protein U6G28_00105 [Actinomycetaceae bacterium MB13-C1-2]
MKTPDFDALSPKGTPVRVGLLIWAAVLGIIGLLMVIVPLAGSTSTRGVLVFLFLLTGASMIALAVWLARNPNSTLDDARKALFNPKAKDDSGQPESYGSEPVEPPMSGI